MCSPVYSGKTQGISFGLKNQRNLREFKRNLAKLREFAVGEGCKITLLCKTH